MRRPSALGRRTWLFLIGLVPAVALLLWFFPPATLGETTSSRALPALKQSVVNDYAVLVLASYEDALAGARALKTSIGAFLDAPGVDTLNRARRAWLDARVPYTQTEAYRFYDGPIESVEGLVNAWPIDENLIDYVDGEPDAGVINHPERFPAITPELIVSLNERDGEKNITAGFHAIEFLLWGQDMNDEGAGARSYLDYVDGSAENAGRRRDYLRVVAGLLVTDLETVVSEWTTGDPANYRARFTALPADEALAAILKGLGTLSGAELAGERLTVPYETKEQEDEHSCFSDNTQRDVLNDTVGIQNVYRGRYQRTSGETVAGLGLFDLLSRVDPQLARSLDERIGASVAAARLVPDPFDRAILGTDEAPGRVAVRTLVAALRAQADAIAQAGSTLGLTLNF